MRGLSGLSVGIPGFVDSALSVGVSGLVDSSLVSLVLWIVVFL